MTTAAWMLFDASLTVAVYVMGFVYLACVKV